jgi:hypothetical protein
MKYLKIYENFMDSRNSGIAADLEAGEIENDQIYADMDADNFGTEESQFGAEEILAKWQEAFGDKTPTTQEKYDFYHDLREEGFDGILIFDTLGDKMDREEDEYSFDDVHNESNEEGCMDCKCSPCKCNEEKEEECAECNDDDCCPKCNCKPCECK